MDPQLIVVLAAHKTYLKAYKELNKKKIHDSYTKYFAANKDKIKEYQQTYQRGACNGLLSPRHLFPSGNVKTESFFGPGPS